MSGRAALLLGSGLLLSLALGSLGLFGPAELTPSLACSLAGLLASAGAATYTMARATHEGQASAALWFRLVPATTGSLWAAASWLQALTAEWWNTPFALGAQLAATGLWSLLALVVSVVVHGAKDAESRREVERVLRDHEEALAARDRSATPG